MAMKSKSNSRNSSRHNREHMADINVTPMVDVMLVLLIIFMVTAPMLTAGVSVDLPQANAKPLPGNDEPLSVSIASNGKVYVQKTEVPLKDIQTKLKAITGEKVDTRIFVRGDKSVDYGRIMQVVGEVNSAGFTKVSLVTEVGSPPQATGR
jgi:biopolymer transport protein TolR